MASCTLKSNSTINPEALVTRERRRWQREHLLAPNALRDFVQLTTETFGDLRSKYYSPADLAAEMQRRALRFRRRKEASTRSEREEWSETSGS